MSTIPKEALEKIKEKFPVETAWNVMDTSGIKRYAAEWGYQLATDWREQGKTDFDRTTFPAQGQKPFGYDEKKEAEELAYILRERPTNDGREELEKEIADLYQELKSDYFVKENLYKEINSLQSSLKEKDQEIESWKESKESWEYIANEKSRQIEELKAENERLNKITTGF